MLKKIWLVVLMAIVALTAVSQVEAVDYFIDGQLYEGYDEPELAETTATRVPIVVITDDDGYLNSAADAYSGYYRLPITYFPTVSWLGSTGFKSFARLKSLQNREKGPCEVGYHGLNHEDAASLGYDWIVDDSQQCRTILADNGINMSKGYAPTYGSSVPEVIRRLISDGEIESSRQAFQDGTAYNYPGTQFDPANIAVVSVKQDVSLPTLRRLISRAVDKRLMLVLVFHKISKLPAIGDPYDYSYRKYRKMIDHIVWHQQENGLQVLTLSDAVCLMKQQ